MIQIKKVELVANKPKYLKYYFENGDTKILPSALYELICFRDVLKKEIEPLVFSEQAKEEPNSNILNILDNIDSCINPELDSLLNQIIVWQSSAINLYKLLQKIEQTGNSAVSKKRDSILSYDVITQTLFPSVE